MKRRSSPTTVAAARNAFLAALSKITGTGNFHSEGVETFFPPEIEVKGVGTFPSEEIHSFRQRNRERQGFAALGPIAADFSAAETQKELEREMTNSA